MKLLNRSWVEIDLNNLHSNLDEIRRHLNPGVKLMAIVKADAYGHGVGSLAPLLESWEADWFGVASLNEARILRSVEITRPILVLGYTFPEQIAQAAKLSVTQAVVDSSHAERMSQSAVRSGVKAEVHIKVDTGMSRFGFNALEPERAASEIEAVCSLPGLSVTGIFTHFAAADSPFATEFTEYQHRKFMQVVELLGSRGITFENVHCCNSAATFSYPQFQHNMVRCGISLYGHSPSGQPLEGIDLRPVMTLKASICHIKQLHAGEPVGYGCTFVADRDMKTATVSLGYANGFPRALSNRGVACVNDAIVPIVGNICMDYLMLDVTDIKEPAVGDTAIFFGGGSPIALENLSGMVGTISYELLTDISRSVPRIYLENGQIVDAVDYTL